MSNAVQIIGYRNSLDVSPARTIAASASYTFPTQARVHDVVSSSANDASAGTGARTLLLEGVDGNWEPCEEVVTLNGVTPVSTSKSYLWLRMSVLTAGSGLVNAGTITATAQTDATNTASMQAATTPVSLQNISADGAYVTRQKTGLTILQLHICPTLTTASTAVRWQIQEASLPGGPWRTAAAGGTVINGDSSVVVPTPGLYIPAKRYVRLVGLSSVAANPVFATLYGHLGAPKF